MLDAEEPDEARVSCLWTEDPVLAVEDLHGLAVGAHHGAVSEHVYDEKSHRLPTLPCASDGRGLRTPGRET